MMSHVQVPKGQEKRALLYRAKGSVRAIVNRIHGVLLITFLLGKKIKLFSLLLGSAINTGHVSSPFWPPDST